MFITLATCIICSAFVSTYLHVEPSNPFPPPNLTIGNHGLENVLKYLEATIQRTAASGQAPWATDRTEFAVELTSTESTLWKTSYAISDDVTDETYFRIASITKVFTVLAVLVRQKAGKWSIKDSIAQHVPELTVGNNGGGIKWEAITLESLASQLSGIPRECTMLSPIPLNTLSLNQSNPVECEDGQGDMSDYVSNHQLGFEDPLEIGLPPVSENEIPKCGFGRKGSRPCSREGKLLFYDYHLFATLIDL